MYSSGKHILYTYVAHRIYIIQKNSDSFSAGKLLGHCPWASLRVKNFNCTDIISKNYAP